MAKLFQDMLQRSQDLGILFKKSVDAREWFRNEAGGIKKSIATKEIRSELLENTRSFVTVGRLYMFKYQPKYEATLPFYDAFPVVFPISKTPEGFLGLNMHYLPPQYRAILMDSLYTLINNEKYDYSTRLQKISYNVLKSASRFRYFRPCLKHYLNSYVVSRFIYVHPLHWETALFLPLEQFKKSTTSNVRSNSIKSIRKAKGQVAK